MTGRERDDSSIYRRNSLLIGFNDASNAALFKVVQSAANKQHDNPGLCTVPHRIDVTRVLVQSRVVFGGNRNRITRNGGKKAACTVLVREREE